MPNYYSDSQAYGSIPNVPAPVSTAPGAVSGAMQLGNLAYQQLPGYNASLGNIGQNIQSMTAGQLPADVIRQIQQGAAERGIATGTPGSQNTNASYLRALGLTSLDLTGRGQDALLKQLPALPGAQISQNPNFYVSPQLQQETATANAIYQSAPNPAAAARAAMAAAAAGVGAGKGSVGGIGQPTSWWNTPDAPAGPGYASATSPGTGTYINGQYYEAGTGPLGQSAVDNILSKYNPATASTGDPETDYFNSLSQSGGTPASATAPAGTSSGSYYAGDAAGYDGGGGDDFYSMFGDE